MYTKHYLRATKLILLTGLYFLLLSCATHEHRVSSEALQQSKDRLFRIGSIEVPCGKGGLYERGQVALLDGTPVSKVRQVLTDAYGLNIETETCLTLKEYPISWQGLVPGLGGRCFYKENASYDKNGDVISIVFTFSDRLTIPPLTTLCYEITGKSSGVQLMKHKGELGDFKKFSSSPFPDDRLEHILKTAQKLPEVLRRDLAETGAKNPPPATDSREGTAEENGPNKEVQSSDKASVDIVIKAW